MHIQLPNSNIKQHAVLGKRGMGMGSVLLSKGGPGGASSYRNVEDYEHITNRNVKQIEPIGGAGFIPKRAGKLERLGDKLGNLSIRNQDGIKPRIKNITMSI